MQGNIMFEVKPLRSGALWKAEFCKRRRLVAEVWWRNRSR